ncbi:MAG: hypothetical protein ACTHU0_29075 [Kofleriaceae bacterium]
MTTRDDDDDGTSRQRIAFVLAALATAPVWYALTRITTYDPVAYLALDGFQASRGTWVLLASGTLASIALAWRGPDRRWPCLATVASLIASIIAVRVAIHTSTPPDPVPATSYECRTLFGCVSGAGELEAIERPGALPGEWAKLRRPVNISTFASIGALSILGLAVALRPRAGRRQRDRGLPRARVRRSGRDARG